MRDGTRCSQRLSSDHASLQDRWLYVAVHPFPQHIPQPIPLDVPSEVVRCFERCTLLLNGEERVVPKPTVPGIIAALNQSRRVFPPLKKLLFEAFWFVFAAVEIVRFLRSLL